MTKTKIDNYKNSLVEVEAALNCLEYNAYRKIPNNIIQAIHNNKNEDYIFEYDENLDYDKWNLSIEAKAILYNIFKRYIANEEEKRYFREKEKYEIMQIEKQKSSKYDSNDIFKKTDKNIINEAQNKEKTELIKSEKERWYIKFINKIKNRFKRK